MKILFIRHGETTDNIRHVYAGITDSLLTAHGALQTERLASHLASKIPPLTHIFASPLSRAKKTAEAILAEQKKIVISNSVNEDSESKDATLPDVTESTGNDGNRTSSKDAEAATEREIYFKIDADLIEQDFGSYEGETFLNPTPKKRKRSVSSMTSVADSAKKRRADEEDDEASTGNNKPTTTTDVVMTAGEEGPLQGTTDTAADPEKDIPSDKPKVIREEEEEGEEEEEFREMENTASIKSRAESFIRRCIVPLLPGEVNTPLPAPPTENQSEPSPTPNDHPIVAIVSHGMLLSFLWKAFVSMFPPSSVLATTYVVNKGWYQGKHPGWGNTGYLAVEVLPKGTVSQNGMTVVIEGVNEKMHLQGLKRTLGGIGSEKFDEKQTKLEGFFGKKEGEESATKLEEGKGSKL